jgi:cystathionine gamma-synthase
MNKKNRFGTLCIRAGKSRPFDFKPPVVPIIQNAAFEYDKVADWIKVGKQKRSGYIYPRNANPTVRALEKKMASLDGAKEALAFSSGMAAICCSLLAPLEAGDRVVSFKYLYGGTYVFLNPFLPRFVIRAVLCDTDGLEEIEKKIPMDCRALYFESPTNSTLKILDIERMAGAGRSEEMAKRKRQK